MTRRPLGKHMTAEPLGDEWVVHATNGDLLGGVLWYARWRQFEFVPRAGAAFSWDYLKALSEFLVELNEARRGAGRAGVRT